MPIFGVILVDISPHSTEFFPHSDWMRRYTPCLSVFSSNVGKCGPEELRIQTLFTQWPIFTLLTNHFWHSAIFHVIYFPCEKTKRHNCCLIGKKTFNVDKIRAISDYPFWDLLLLEKEESCWYHRYKICAIALNALYGAWKMSKYGVFSSPYFLHSEWIQENTDYKNSVFGHFSSSDTLNLCISFITIW